jgi:CheY-like chemotaxis protein
MRLRTSLFLLLLATAIPLTAFSVLLTSTLLRHVRKCYNAVEALALARQFQADVAFIDLNMPGMSGLELARELRAQPWASGMRLLALTGMGQKTDVEATRAAGFDAHVTKPASADELRRAATGVRADVVPLDAGRRPGSAP